MITVETNQFFLSLDVPQTMQWYLKMATEMEREVKPQFTEGVRDVAYVHFVVIEGITNVYLSVDALYTDYGGPEVSRKINSVRVYRDEVDMEFYMALLEYNNTIEPNPIIFTGPGKRIDVIRP